MKPRKIATLDMETDPFRRGTTVEPFVIGLYDGDDYVSFWGSDCIARLVEHLGASRQPYLIFSHNGGRFDFTFLLEHIDPDVSIHDGRIVKCRLGNHELRDSYSIMPLPLSELADKMDIRISKLSAGVRDRHRAEIERYLRQDCEALHGAVLRFHDLFGKAPTMASVGMNALRNYVSAETGLPSSSVLERLTLEQDATFRAFYFMGRTQCLERGVIKGKWSAYDTNSMFPWCMATYEHPTGNLFIRSTSIDDRTDFVDFEGISDGALPFRLDSGRVSWPMGRGRFRVSGHEARMALRLGKLSIVRINGAWRCGNRRKFTGFVDHYYNLRLQAAAAGDRAAALYKLLLNTPTGKFAINPNRLEEWEIHAHGDRPDGPAWTPGYHGELVTFWRRPVSEAIKRSVVINVATGASITGAARAELMLALHGAERPIYCDTDGVIAESIDRGIGSAIGEWKVEAEADEAAIAEPKVYALFKGGLSVKSASKGGILTPRQIRKLASGAVVAYHSQKPSINPAGAQTYGSRTYGNYDRS